MHATPPSSDPKKQTNRAILSGILVLLVLVCAAYFRFSGIFWGEYQYLHPDERFLVWVGTDISPVKSLGEYFDTTQSSLNPHNRGHGFYVYGTLPMFLTRYVVEAAFGQSGFDEMTQVGRVLSSLADLITVYLVYLVGRRLYNARVALLGSAFYGAAVLPIQQSHFFTMDTFTTMFTMLAFYFAVLVATSNSSNGGQSTRIPETDQPEENSPQKRSSKALRKFIHDPYFLPSLGFGLALGMAVASKLNAAPMAIILPAAMGVHILTLPAERREGRIFQALLYLIFAALVSLVVFRIFQPYAFSGPGFFGLKPNPQWVQNIREQRAQSGGDVDFPPAMQWARRPVWFSFQNMVLWGLGLPLGILAWAGFLWAGWRLFKGGRNGYSNWTAHALIWGWTALYFAWQSIQLNPTMRYQLPIYPTLAIFAAWAVVTLYDLRRPERAQTSDAAAEGAPGRPLWARPAAILIGGIVLISTFAYAFAFSRIYERTITRVEASHWIYQNIPGPITLPIRTETGTSNQIIPVPYDTRITSQLPYSATFIPKTAGTLTEVLLPNVRDENPSNEGRNLTVAINTIPLSKTPLSQGSITENLSSAEDRSGKSLTISLDSPLALDPDKTYQISISLPPGEQIARLDENLTLYFEPFDSTTEPYAQTARSTQLASDPNNLLLIDFRAEVDGLLSKIFIPSLEGGSTQPAPKLIGVTLHPEVDTNETLYSEVAVQPDEERGGFEVTLLSQLPVLTGERYRLILAVEPQGGVIALNGQGLANEGEWDDGLPLRLEGYDGFGGIYPQELNFNMYWDDNPDKLERFVRILDEADTLVISSNRQWGSLPRIPERFPLTTAYYRNLIGCPESQSIETCYRVAQPGQYHGNLGFDLAQVFESNPRIGPFSLNDQFAEEAFTVYDHPKVLVFQKRTDYDPEKVREILGSVDFSQIIRKPPLQYDSNPADLMLPEGRWAVQQQAGTWAELFDTQAPQNRYPILSVLVWYLSLSLLGLLTYPILRRALPGLPDHGYPLARTAGMLLLSYLVWLAGSLNLPFTRPTISLGIGLLAAVGILLAYQQRTELRQEWKAHQRYFWIVEALLLGLFLAFLVVRIGNPDLWHPWKGGEKPMDFSYFNAVLKSTSFPPYDPWFAGGYLNYYYYGFVLVGVLVKWLGIVPATAYNLILPTLFSLIAMGAFSLSWNLSRKAQASRARPGGTQESRISPYIPALAAALGMAILGNQGTVKVIYQGYQKLAAPGGMIEEANLATRLVWAVRGFLETLQGQRLPYGIGDWYWLPSRIIPGQGDIEPITEFPYFTVLYADLHAHLVALPLTLLALTFIVGLVLGKGHWKGLSGGIAWFLMAGLALGALRPTNTWDLPPYLALGVIGVFYTFWSYSSVQFKASPRPAFLSQIHPTLLRWLLSIGGAALLVGLTFLLYQPYAAWYALGYTQIGLWEGSHTPLSAYLSHWGLFLVVILPWMAWETRDWLAKTPLSGLRKLKPYQFLILFSLALLILATAALQLWQEVAIAWLVLPAAAWAGVLILRPNMPDAKRIVLFLIGSGFMLTLMVEAIVLRGDIGRMNTVFKFYLQVWTMFSISAAAALGWLWPALEDWSPGWRYAWQAVFAVLVAGASLYPITATMAKIEDRMAENAPHTLDGMAFIPYSTYTDEWGEMQLDQDYKAIRWLQENVEGSPVIVEANLRNLYRWGSRYTIYTGLPGVVGWEWHQQQQRAVTPGIWVSNRIKEIDDFYLTTDLKLAADFLKKYNVKYIIVGQQERGHYPGPGLAKFEQAEGILWQEVYSDGDTAIYKVIEAPS